MKRFGLFLAGAALIGGTALAQQARRAPQPQPAARAPVALPDTQALFDGYVRDDKMPGIVAAFGAPGRPPVYVSAGRIGDEPGAAAAGPDSLWRIYSMTKPVTAMAAMILIEEGKLGLDQPIHEILPRFRDMRVLTDGANSLASRPAARAITVRHLLTHTAGLGYNIVTKGPLLKQYERLGILPGTVNALVESQARPVRPASLAEFADRVAGLPLIADPGSTWSYSIGLDLLGAVVERASGQPFDRFLQTRIFAPLGMTSTYFTVPKSEAGRFATNYLFAGDTRVPLDPAATSVYLSPPSFPYGGAGLVSSARDFDRFLAMLQSGGTLDGARVMKPETVRLALSNLLPAGTVFRGIGGGTGGTQGNGTEMGYGAGGSVYLVGKPGGPGKGTYGWGGAAGTIAYVDPENGIRGTVMVNYFPDSRWPLRQEIPPALTRDFARLRR